MLGLVVLAVACIVASCGTTGTGSPGTSRTIMPGAAANTTGTVTVPGTSAVDPPRTGAWREDVTGAAREQGRWLWAMPVKVPRLTSAACPVAIGAPRLPSEHGQGLFRLPSDARRLHLGAPTGSTSRFVQIGELVEQLDDAGSVRHTLVVPDGCDVRLAGLDGENPVVRTCSTSKDPGGQIARASCAVIDHDLGSPTARWMVPVSPSTSPPVFSGGRLLDFDGAIPGQIDPITGDGEVYEPRAGECDAIRAVKLSTRAPMFTFTCTATVEGTSCQRVRFDACTGEGTIDARPAASQAGSDTIPSDLSPPSPVPQDLARRMAAEAGLPDSAQIVSDEARPDGRWIQLIDPAAFSRFPGGAESAAALFRVDPTTTRTVASWTISTIGAYRTNDVPGLVISDGPSGTVLVNGYDAVGLLPVT